MFSFTVSIFRGALISPFICKMLAPHFETMFCYKISLDSSFNENNVQLCHALLTSEISVLELIFCFFFNFFLPFLGVIREVVLHQILKVSVLPASLFPHGSKDEIETVCNDLAFFNSGVRGKIVVPIN